MSTSVNIHGVKNYIKDLFKGRNIFDFAVKMPSGIHAGLLKKITS